MINGSIHHSIVDGNYKQVKEDVEEAKDIDFNTRAKAIAYATIHAVNGDVTLSVYEMAFSGVSEDHKEEVTGSAITGENFDSNTGVLIQGSTAKLQVDATGGNVQLTVEPAAGAVAEVRGIAH